MINYEQNAKDAEAVLVGKIAYRTSRLNEKTMSATTGSGYPRSPSSLVVAELTSVLKILRRKTWKKKKK